MGIRVRRILQSPDRRTGRGYHVRRGHESAGEVLCRPLHNQASRCRRALVSTIPAVSRDDPPSLQIQGASGRTGLHSDDRERVQSAGGVARGRQGTMAVHGRDGSAVWPARGPLGRRTPRPREVHGGGGRVSARPARTVWLVGPRPGRLQCGLGNRGQGVTGHWPSGFLDAGSHAIPKA